MPHKPKHPCNYPGCPELTHARYCEKHEKQETARYEKERGNFRQRGYTSRWDKLRKAVLMNEPLCRECMKQGRATPASIVHHIVSKAEGGNDDMDNLEPLCRQHHNEKHKEDRWRPRKQGEGGSK